MNVTLKTLFKYKILLKIALGSFCLLFAPRLFADVTHVHLQLTKYQVLIYLIPIFVLCIGIYLLFLLTIKQRNKLGRLRRRCYQLEKEQSIKDTFLANTAHEIRTPINAIINLSEVLINQEKSKPALVNSLNLIKSTSWRLSFLLNDLLDYSQQKYATLQLARTTFDVHRACQDCCDLLAFTIDRPELSLVNAVPRDQFYVYADMARTQQVLFNLIGNAIKATSQGEIRISAGLDKGRVWVKITDSGRGIPRDELERIFSHFYQFDDSYNYLQTGSGLGLSISKSLISHMGGEISAQSTVGEGSTFSFSLPISESEATLSTETVASDFQLPNLSDAEIESYAANSGAIPDATIRILVVDDEAVNRSSLASLLSLREFSVDTVSSGKLAIERILNNPIYDLLLIDVLMPDMSGFDVCKKIRVYYSLQVLPIIFLTGMHRVQDMVMGFSVGANDFITKPFEVLELFSRVDTQIRLLDLNRHLEAQVSHRTQSLTDAYQELEAHNTIIEAINKEHSVEPILDIVLNESANLFSTIKGVSYWQYDHSTKQYTLYTVGESDCAQVVTISLDALLQAQRACAVNAIHLYYYDTQALPLDSVTSFNAQQMLAAHVHVDGEEVGMLVFIDDTADDLTHILPTVSRFVGQVTSALSKAKLVSLLQDNCIELEGMSVTDPLTGLSNRRFIEANLAQDIENINQIALKRAGKRIDVAAQANQDFVFFIIDIDHFKHVNDTYGHSNGDIILSGVAKKLRSLFRESDYVARWGGEEFVIVARHTNRNSADVLAEKIRDGIAQLSFSFSGFPAVGVTVSVGFSCYPFQKEFPVAHTWPQILELADKCLYGAKRSGRNAWVGLIAEQVIEQDILPDALVDPVCVSDKYDQLLRSSLGRPRLKFDST